MFGSKNRAAKRAIKEALTHSTVCLQRFDQLQPGDKVILLVKVGNDTYPAVSETHVDKIGAIFREALDGLGLKDVRVISTNHTVDAIVLPISRQVSR